MLAGQNRTGDIEKVIENAVYLHLKNLGYKISVGTLPNGEIDFVVEKAAHQSIYRWLISSLTTRQWSGSSEIC